MDPVLNSLNEVEGLMSTFKEELADIGCHIHLGRGNTILCQKTERQSIDRLIMDQRDRLNKKTEKEYRDLEKRFENSLASVFRQESTDAHNVFLAMITEERTISNKAFLQVQKKCAPFLSTFNHSSICRCMRTQAEVPDSVLH